ncbi:MAG TPA: hypothetical protein VK037_04825, partial [Pseudogracilibacillus sp.]|nr:hypothetical protein [Pseudogracilibacillus sp.]
YEDYRKTKSDEAINLYFVKPTGQIYFYATDMKVYPQIGDKIVSLTPMKIDDKVNGKGTGK